MEADATTSADGDGRRRRAPQHDEPPPPLPPGCARPTEARVARLLNDIDAVAAATVRPTEAQLRWAQFTRRQKAECVRAMVENLMFRPADVGDVAGARDGDGDTTATESGRESSGESSSSSSSAGEGRGSGQSTGGPPNFRDRDETGTRGAETHGTRSTPAVGGMHSTRGSDFSASCASSPSSGGVDAAGEKGKTKRRRRRRRKGKAKRKKKVPVSRGRRALLRVSARAVEDRKRAAAEERGYNNVAPTTPANALTPSAASANDESFGRDDGFADPFFPDGATGGKAQRWGSPSSRLQAKLEGADRRSLPSALTSTRSPGTPASAGVASLGEISDCFGDDFASPTTGAGGDQWRPPLASPAAAPTLGVRGTRARNRAQQRSRSGMTPSTRRFTAELYNEGEDESRVRRFEEAFHAMMLNSTVATQAKASARDWVRPPTKRWTRGSHLPVIASVDGRAYDDLQRAPAIRHQKGSPLMGVQGGVDGAGFAELQDRGASWLVHIPKMISPRNELLLSNQHSPEGPVDVSAADLRDAGEWGGQPSPGQAKFEEIVSQYQAADTKYVSPEKQKAMWKRQARELRSHAGDMASMVAMAAADVAGVGQTSPEKKRELQTAERIGISASEKEGKKRDRGALPRKLTATTVVPAPKVLRKSSFADDRFQKAAQPRAHTKARGKTPEKKAKSTKQRPEPLLVSSSKGQDALADPSTTVQTPFRFGVNVKGLRKMFSPGSSSKKTAESAPTYTKSFSYKKMPIATMPSSDVSAPESDNGYSMRGTAIVKTIGKKENSWQREEEKVEVDEELLREEQRVFDKEETEQMADEEQRQSPSPLAATGLSEPERDLTVNQSSTLSSISSLGHIVGSQSWQQQRAESVRSPDRAVSPVSLSSLLNMEAEEEAEEERRRMGLSAPPNQARAAAERTLSSPHRKLSISPEQRSRVSTPSEVSAEHVSALLRSRIATFQRDIIDTDATMEDNDDASHGGGTAGDPESLNRVGTLMLSPTILTKRLQQAMQAVEAQNWKQVSYLVSANPWLAEMVDVRTDQHLLHKLALHGVSDDGCAENNDDNASEDANSNAGDSAPKELCSDLLDRFGPAVHKFDQDGNIPLHMACASGNVHMIRLLGERFPSGASVRNNDGMLPLHLAVTSCIQDPAHGGCDSSDGVRLVLDLFPGGVGVCDNNGNLPLHIAAESLQGDLGVDVIFMLLCAADKAELRLPVDARLGLMSSKAKLPHEADFDGDGETDVTAATTDDGTNTEDSSFCNLVKNGEGHTPLAVAVRAMSGWQVVEALVRGSGGQQAALVLDENLCNTFHLLVSGEFADAASALSLLKIAPRAASISDGEGILPVEAACLNSMPREVIMALVLVDLPIDLDKKEAKAGLLNDRRGQLGGSWWFLNCECDDAHADIVKEILSICTYQQARELCFFNKRGGSVISRATPKNKRELRKVLRFVGRFEFLGSHAIQSDEALGLKVFDALDFGTDDEPFDDGRRILLKCYGREESYAREISLMEDVEFDPIYVEDISYFCVDDLGVYTSENAPSQYIVTVERPTLTLARVAAGMPKGHEYRQDTERFQRYLGRVGMVLRLISKGVRHMHQEGVVHGNLSLETCGKFGDQWKLMGVTKSIFVGDKIPSSLMGENSPPESIDAISKLFKKRFAGSPAMDIWAFGKLMFEVLVGASLVAFSKTKKPHHDMMALATIGGWNEGNLQGVVDQLTEAGIGTLGIDLVTHCLCPLPKDRPESMEEILKHPFWKNSRRRGKSLASGRRSKGKENEERRKTTSMI